MRPHPTRRGFTLIELLVVIAVIAVLIAMLLPAVQKVREAAYRLQCQNQNRQLGLAFHNYENVHRAFPAGWYDNFATPPQPGRSFIPDILPFIEQDNLARLYRKDLEWTDAANATAIATTIPVLICPSAPSRPGQAISDYTVNYGVAADAYTGLGIPVSAPPSAYLGFHFGSGLQVRTSDVTDGLSNTLMIQENAGRPDLWLLGIRQPPVSPNPAGNEKWADPNNRILIQVWYGNRAINCHNGNEIYSFHPGGVNVVVGDGSVRFLSENISPATFLAIITRAGGEVTGADW